MLTIIPENTPMFTTTAGVFATTTRVKKCQDQFAALLASSVARCGASSPAHLAASNSQLMLTVWRDFIVGSARCFVLEFDNAVSVAFSVSPITLGVADSPLVIRHTRSRYSPAQWIGPRVSYFAKYSCYTSLFLVTPDGPEDGVCVASDLQTPCPYGVNLRWLVACELKDGSSRSCVLRTTDLQALQGQQQQEHLKGNCGLSARGTTPVRTPIVIPSFTNVGFSGINKLVMSSTNPDEALLWSFVERRGSFALIDVAQTHATNTLAVLCTTQSVFPLWVTSTDVTIHRKASGEVVYIVAVHLPFKGKNSLFKVESTTGTVTQIVSECKHHSRVSSSLFCVGVGDEYQLWDCNNTEHALRSVCITGEGDSDIKQVVGGSGFLFVLRGGNMVSVIEALSGTPVLTFEVSCTLSAIDTKASLL